MRFRFEHRFPAPRDTVERAVLDREFQERLAALPNVAERTVLTTEDRGGGVVHRVIRYRFAGNLPAAVAATIGADSVSWDEVSTFDPDEHVWRFEIRPHVFADGFECMGTHTYMDDGEETVRVVEGELEVKIPFVGGRVERTIVEGLQDTMDAEARMLADYLRERTGPRT